MRWRFTPVVLSISRLAKMSEMNKAKPSEAGRQKENILFAKAKNSPPSAEILASFCLRSPLFLCANVRKAFTLNLFRSLKSCQMHMGVLTLIKGYACFISNCVFLQNKILSLKGPKFYVRTAKNHPFQRPANPFPTACGNFR